MLTYMLSDTDLATAHMHIRPEYKGALNKGASFGKCISNKQQFIHMTGHLYGSLPTKSYASASACLLLGYCNNLQSWTIGQFHKVQLESFMVPTPILVWGKIHPKKKNPPKILSEYRSRYFEGMFPELFK